MKRQPQYRCLKDTGYEKSRNAFPHPTVPAMPGTCTPPPPRSARWTLWSSGTWISSAIARPSARPWLMCRNACRKPGSARTSKRTPCSATCAARPSLPPARARSLCRRACTSSPPMPTAPVWTSSSVRWSSSPVWPRPRPTITAASASTSGWPGLWPCTAWWCWKTARASAWPSVKKPESPSSPSPTCCPIWPASKTARPWPKSLTAKS